LFGGLPKDRLTQDLVNAVDYLNSQSFVRHGKIDSVGFCFGGGLSINLACNAQTAACVIFYGENPSPIELVEKIKCPVLGIYGGEDERINATLDRLVAVMTRYKKDFEMRVYPGAPHAFFNDTNPTTYREQAAKKLGQSPKVLCPHTPNRLDQLRMRQQTPRLSPFPAVILMLQRDVTENNRGNVVGEVV